MDTSRILKLRRPLIFLAHLIIAVLSYILAFLLRFDGNISENVAFGQFIGYILPGNWALAPPEMRSAMLIFLRPLPYMIALKLVALSYFQLYRGYWRYFGTYDLMRIIKACTASSVCLVIVVVFLLGPGFPRSVFLLDWLMSICAFSGIRLLVRLFRETVDTTLGDSPGRRTLIIGAGDTGETALRELRKHFRGVYNVIGFLDDDPEKQGLLLHGVKVIGTTRDAARAVREHQVEEVLFAITSASKQFVREVVERCEGQAVRFRMLPNLGDIIAGKLKLHRIREVSVEDLLGRDPVLLNSQRVGADLEGKCVLVTGAGGSIGSELVRQIAPFQPARIILFEIAETPLFEIDRQMGELFPRQPREAVLGDIMHPEKVEEVFAAFKPDRVFHAAAFKHVPMMEKHPVDAVLNNVLGTRVVAEAAIRHGTQKFVLISSDKAVHPRNVMGASKRCAELLLSTLNSNGTHFIAVRFGNVLGSSGSVVPIFRQQIAQGGPVRVTHPEATRYFMTIPEAVELVLQACAIGSGGETFLLEMGEPVPIVTLARNMIELSGLRLGDDIEIEYTGLRPGEKLHEELIITGENVTQTEVPKVMVHRAAPRDLELIRAKLGLLEEAALAHRPDLALLRLFELAETRQEA